MLNSVAPHAVVNATIVPHVGAQARLFVVLILALVSTTILPDVDALTMHLASLPLSFIAGLILAVGQLAISVHKPVHKLAFVDLLVSQVPRAIGPLLAFLEVPLVFGAIGMSLDTISVLSIHEQASFIAVLECSALIFTCHFALPLGHTLIE